MKKLPLIIVALALVALPLLASAASQPIKSNVWDVSILKGPLVTCWGGPIGNDGNPNPYACENLCDFVWTVLNVIYYVIAFVIWIIAPISVAAAGIMFMLAGGNPEMEGRAKKTLTGVVWGLAIVLCSYLLVSTFVKVLGINGVGGFGQSFCKIS